MTSEIVNNIECIIEPETKYNYASESENEPTEIIMLNTSSDDENDEPNIEDDKYETDETNSTSSSEEENELSSNEEELTTNNEEEEEEDDDDEDGIKLNENGEISWKDEDRRIVDSPEIGVLTDDDDIEDAEEINDYESCSSDSEDLEEEKFIEKPKKHEIDYRKKVDLDWNKKNLIVSESDDDDDDNDHCFNNSDSNDDSDEDSERDEEKYVDIKADFRKKKDKEWKPDVDIINIENVDPKKTRRVAREHKKIKKQTKLKKKREKEIFISKLKGLKYHDAVEHLKKKYPKLHVKKYKPCDSGSPILESHYNNRRVVLYCDKDDKIFITPKIG